MPPNIFSIMTAILIIHSLLFDIANSLCLDLNELQGSCTDCGDLQLLLQSNCYLKQRGCLNYKLPGPACTNCQNGYVLYQQKCIRQAVFNNMNISKPIPPVVVESPPTLTLEEIVFQVGEENKLYYSDANQIALSNYSDLLGKGSVVSVDKLTTKKGLFFVTVYQSSINSNKYESVAFLNQQNKISLIYFKIAGETRTDPFSLDRELRITFQGKLTISYILYELSYTDQGYTFRYMNNNDETVYQIKFKVNDVGPSLNVKALIIKLGIIDLAREELFQKYPELKSKTLMSQKKYEQFYSFSFDSDVSASVKFSNFRFQVNKPIQTSVKMPSFDVYGVKFDFFNIFGLFNLFDQSYNSCLNLLQAQIPELRSLGVISSKQSKGTPQNGQYDKYFYIVFGKFFNSDNYEAYTVYTADNSPKILLVLKNKNTAIYSLKHNYNADPYFFKGYINATQESKVVNIPSIESVFMKSSGSNTNYYKVYYSSAQFLQFKYNKAADITTLISYTVDGQNILLLLGVLGQTQQKNPPKLYYNYVKTLKQIAIFSDVANFATGQNNKNISFVNSEGTFTVNLLDEDNTYKIVGYSQVSASSCFDFTQLKQNQQKQIDQFLRKHYNLQGYQLKLTQCKVNRIGRRFRVLYSNQKLNQKEFSLQKLATFFNVLQSKSVNQGYEVILPNSDNGDFQKVVNYLTSATSFIGKRTPLLVQSNKQKIRSYLNNQTSTIQILFNRNPSNTKIRVLQNRPYLLVPNGFDIQNLLIPGSPSLNQQANINKLISQAQSQNSQLSDAKIAFVDKKGAIYNLMFKSTSRGFIKCTGKFLGNKILIENLETTSYKDADFSNCRNFDPTGRCLSCDKSKQEYQGNCWSKIEGCLIQAGKICLKCQNPYILSETICKKDCRSFIK